jgi:hypothetical protein
MSQAPAVAEERTNDGRCIVAIPTATEPVHHLGDVSEPKHMTMVWLGKPEDNPELDMDQVRGQVEAVAQRSGPLTGLVESTGQLGDDDATVWFLRGDGIEEARNDLLSQSYIRDGFGAVEQYPSFTPHVTAGYGMEQPPSDEESPEEIIFDRLAVWDGDEHTEYPLGPSASSEENTEGSEAIEPPADLMEAGLLMIPETMAHTVPGADMGLDQRFLDELTQAMTEPIVDDIPLEGDHLLIDAFGQVPRLAVDDAASLASACAAADQITEELPRVFTRRRLVKRARELGCQHLIPRDWLRKTAPGSPTPAGAPTSVPAPDVSDVAPAYGSDVPDLFQLKTQQSTLPDTALRAAYMRGVREFTMTAPQSRPPLPRDVIAQARVNSLIRLAQGDLSARTDDRDLLR